MFYSKPSFLKDIGAYDHRLPTNLLRFTKQVMIQYKEPISIFDFL